jgi:hypothetical protein
MSLGNGSASVQCVRPNITPSGGTRLNMCPASSVRRCHACQMGCDCVSRVSALVVRAVPYEERDRGLEAAEVVGEAAACRGEGGVW